jgi:polysaccharide chain length determinant protein (PEP-CTERM system associated)
MYEKLNELIFRVKGALKYKRLAIVLSWVICLSGWSLLLALPNKYKSEAQVHVDTKSMLQPLLKGLAVQQDLRELISIMKQLMFTEQNLQRIAQLAHLDYEGKNPLQQYELIQDLKKDIHIAGMRQQSDLFKIDFESKNPESARDVVQAVLSVFSEQAQKSTTDDADSSQLFIENQLKEYENRLRLAEKARENFKRENFGLLPDDNHNQMQRLNDLNDKLNGSKLTLSEATAERNVLAKQMQDLINTNNKFKETHSGLPLTPVEKKREELLNKKAELLLKFTELHPAVLAINQALGNLNKYSEVTKQLKRNDDQILYKDLIENKYVQDLKMALNNAEGKVASFQSKIKFYQDEIDNLSEELNTRLSVETEMQNLNRDYDSVYANYKALLERREQATLSEKIGNEEMTLKFRIAESPNLPLKPSSPNRILLDTLILIVSLGLGAGVSVSIYFIKPTFMTSKQLREVTGLPVLGYVSYSANAVDLEKSKIENKQFIVLFLGLFFVYSLFISYEYLSLKQVPIITLLKNAL